MMQQRMIPLMEKIKAIQAETLAEVAAAKKANVSPSPAK
jgi:hypothetical protein